MTKTDRIIKKIQAFNQKASVHNQLVPYSRIDLEGMIHVDVITVNFMHIEHFHKYITTITGCADSYKLTISFS